MTSSKLRSSVCTVAWIEAIKGGLVLAVGGGLLELLHRDTGALAFELVGRLHLNPSHRYPHIFIDLAAQLTDARLWALAGLASLYAGLRFVEAYGLWRERAWAEWLALASAGIYVPFELYELAVQVTWVRVGALAINLLVVALMVAVLRQRATKSPRTGR